MLGTDQNFRRGQWEAVEAVAIKKDRVLVIQRTGWGKSLVYFLATRLLRQQGHGPTLLISPLLSLMRNQIEMANRIGIRAYTINSGNRSEWYIAQEALNSNDCDILLISPERLGSQSFTKEILPYLGKNLGLFVVDEAHCISDWGHDFRPDYRRIGRLIQNLDPDIPLLGTTATANTRVINDIQSQFGMKLVTFRGPLARESLRLQNLKVGSRAERLVWLAENLGKFKGSGIIYCQTVQDTQRVAMWLKQQGFSAEAYHASDESEINRPELEAAFMENRIEVLVATVALGMGFDKPDIAYIIHFQRPGSVIAYYQQVGRAGRAIDKAYGILLSGDEDEDIQKFLISNSIPSKKAFQAVYQVLTKHPGLTFEQILHRVNYAPGMVQRILRLLEVDGVVESVREWNELLYFCKSNNWRYQEDKIKKFTDLRWKEWYEINRFVQHRGCLMEFLQRALNDASAKPCGHCANCQGKGLTSDVTPKMVIEAEDFLKECTILLKPKNRVPAGVLSKNQTIPKHLQNETGQSLSYYGDVGWGRMVKEGKYTYNCYHDDLATAAFHLIRNRWNPSPFPKWVTSIPSNRHPDLVPQLTRKIAELLGLPFFPVLERIGNAMQQKTMQNEFMQARNVLDTLVIKKAISNGPVLLVDDIIDSGWTLAMAGYLLRKNGSGPVYPFTLARATGRKKNT